MVDDVPGTTNFIGPWRCSIAVVKTQKCINKIPNVNLGRYG